MCRGLLQNKYDACALKSERKKRYKKIYTQNRKSCRSTLSTSPRDTTVSADYPALPSSRQAVLVAGDVVRTATHARHHQRLFKQTWKIKLKINLTKKGKTKQWLSEIWRRPVHKEPRDNTQPVTYELQTFLCQRVTGYCWPGRGPHVEKATVSGISNRLNYCAIFTVYTQFATWIGHVLRRNCLLQQVTEGKIKGGIRVTGRRGRRRTELLDDFLTLWRLTTTIVVVPHR